MTPCILPICMCRQAVLKSLCTELFCQPFSEQIQEFLLPALAYGTRPFPFVELLNTLVPLCQANMEETSYHTQTGSITDKARSREMRSSQMQPSIWLLCAVLTLAEQHLGQCHCGVLEENCCAVSINASGDYSVKTTWGAKH